LETTGFGTTTAVSFRGVGTTLLVFAGLDGPAAAGLAADLFARLRFGGSSAAFPDGKKSKTDPSCGLPERHEVFAAAGVLSLILAVWLELTVLFDRDTSSLMNRSKMS
jgi:hypothetical protein